MLYLLHLYRNKTLILQEDIEWKGTDSRRIIEGEAYFLRELYYFMATTFGTVPIVPPRTSE